MTHVTQKQMDMAVLMRAFMNIASGSLQHKGAYRRILNKVDRFLASRDPRAVGKAKRNVERTVVTLSTDDLPNEIGIVPLVCIIRFKNPEFFAEIGMQEEWFRRLQAEEGPDIGTLSTAKVFNAIFKELGHD